MCPADDVRRPAIIATAIPVFVLDSCRITVRLEITFRLPRSGEVPSLRTSALDHIFSRNRGDSMFRTSFLALTCIVCLMGVGLAADDQFSPNEEGYIRNWLILAPLPL